MQEGNALLINIRHNSERCLEKLDEFTEEVVLPFDVTRSVDGLQRQQTYPLRSNLKTPINCLKNKEDEKKSVIPFIVKNSRSVMSIKANKPSDVSKNNYCLL